MRYEYGDPGNPNCTLSGLNLSCRITRGKGQCVVDIADDQSDKAIAHIDQMIAWLEMTRHALVTKDADLTALDAPNLDAVMAKVRERYRAEYLRYLEATA